MDSPICPICNKTIWKITRFIHTDGTVTHHQCMHQFDLLKRENSKSDQAIVDVQVSANNSLKSKHLKIDIKNGNGTVLQASNDVVIRDIKMPFMSMVAFMIKWAIASIPAIIILSIIFGIISVMFFSSIR